MIRVQKTLLVVAVAIAVISVDTAVAQLNKPASPPNILFIAIDDLKPDLGCYGVDDVVSPSIDKLAARSTVFLNAHCQYPVCGGSRASLMTGLRPESVGVMDLKTSMRAKNPDVVTLPQFFRNHGYETAAVGKIYDPRCVDDKKTCDAPSWSTPYTSFEHNKIKGAKTKQVTVVSEHSDDELTDGWIRAQGIRLMRELKAGDKPFFLAVGFKKPHLPFVAPKKYWDLYSPEQIKLAEHRGGIENDSGYSIHDSSEFRGYEGVPEEGPFSDQLQRRSIHGYRACVSYVDAQVGMLLDELETLGLKDNTIVVLWGDHGFHLGDHGMFGKHTTLEQASRVPLIIHVPGKKASTTSSPVELCDMYPTLAELTGVKDAPVLDGRSLTPIIADPAHATRDGALTVFKHRGAFGYSLRTKRYRYTEWVNKASKTVATELFDYQKDPLEKVNLADQADMAEIQKTLSAQLRAHAQGCERLKPSEEPAVKVSQSRQTSAYFASTHKLEGTSEPKQPATDARNVEAAMEKLLAQLTLKEKVSLCHANSKFTIAGVERLGIREMWMSDGPHGVREEIARDSWRPAGWDNDHATYLPVLTAVAASFNPEMATLHGSVLGAEARDRGKDVILGPGVNLARNPLYGRNFEYLGEDPFLASAMVVPEIIAIQKNDVAACAKHYALNTQELNRHGVNAQPDERTLREIYLPAFEAAVKEAGVLTVMGAYNEFRGTNCNQSKHLVMDILKGEWGYKGLLMTDWDCDINTHDAAMNGLDIEMGTRKPTYGEYYLASPFLQLLKEGTIPMEVLDDKVRRILRVQLSIGMMDENRLPGARNTEEHHQKARKIIEEGVVLLKNDNSVLPLDQKNIKRLLVMGPNADVAHGHGGGSSQVKSLFEITPLEGLRKKLGGQVEITYLKAAPPKSDGLRPISPDFVVTKDSGAGTPAWKNLIYPDAKQQKNSGFQWATTSTLTFDDGKMHHERLIAEVQPVKSGKHTFQVEAEGNYDLAVDGKSILKVESSSHGETKTADIELEAGSTYKVRLIYNGRKGCTLGWNAPGDLFVDADVYLAAAKKADAVIYFAGLNHGLDREAEDRPDMKLPGSQDHAITELAQANPNTVVFMIAGSAVEMPWVDQISSIVWGWYGGMFAGDAFADILFGDVVPSGKLPITLPNSLADNPHVVLDDYNAEDCFYKESVFMGYRWFEKKKIKPLFPFGYGLSYTSFQYSDLKLSKPTMAQEETLTVSATIKNSGERAGAEIVQLYVQDVESSVERPAKELKGFAKVFLEAGESKAITLKLSKKELSFWDVKSKQWLAEPGAFKIYLGSSSDDLRLQDEFSLN